MNKDPRDRDLYRERVQASDLVRFGVSVKETDLLVQAGQDLADETRELVLTHRLRIEEYIARAPAFLSSLGPLPLDGSAPEIVRIMLAAGRAAGVGPMAAVAGAIAERVGEGLRSLSREVLIENGGDLYLRGDRERVVAIYTGERKLGSEIAIRIRPGDGFGVCTSSGRIGHSLSMGEASTATVLAPSAALADAAATSVGNEVGGADGIERGLEKARRIEGVLGALIVHKGRIGAWGEVELAGPGEE